MLLPQDVLDHIASQLVDDPIPLPSDILDTKSRFWGLHARASWWSDALVAPLCSYRLPAPERTLKKLCFVSRACRRAALRHLFHTIEVTGVAQLHRLLEVLQYGPSDDGDTTPNISSLRPRPHVFIRRLTLWPSGAKKSRFPMSSYALFLDDKLPILLQLLAGNDCSMEGFRLGVSRKVFEEWPYLTSSLRTSIRTLIQQPTMRVISFINIRNLPTYIFRGLEITVLQLKYTRPSSQVHFNKPYVRLYATDMWEFCDAERLEHLPLLPKLEYLCTDDDFTQFWPDGSSAPPSSWRPGALKHLKGCNITVRPYRDNGRILDLAAGSKMENLQIIMRESYTAGTGFRRLSVPLSTFNLGKYPALKKVSILRHMLSGSLTDLAQEARMLEESNACIDLHTLHFRILYWGYHTNQCPNYLIDSVEAKAAWLRLDSIFVSRKYPALRTVRFDITARVRTYETAAEERRMRSFIEGCFERVYTSPDCDVQLEWNICVKEEEHSHFVLPEGSDWDDSNSPSESDSE